MHPTRLFSRLATALGVALLALSADGCSWLLVHGPPLGHERMDYFSCTEEATMPTLDLVMAGLSVAGAVVIGTGSNSGWEYQPYSRDAYLAVGLAEGAAFGLAAGSGFHKVGACREAKRQWLARHPAGTPGGGGAAGTDTLVQAVVLEPRADTLAVGGTVQLIASAHGSSGAAIPGRAFTWLSSDQAVATVGNAGLVIARAAGTVVVTAATGGVAGTAAIVVVPRR